MKTISRIILSLVVPALLFLTGCKKNSTDGPPKNLISATVDASYQNRGVKLWAVIYDDNGNILEYDSLPLGKTTAISTTKSFTGTITITFVQLVSPTSYSGHRLTSYTQITPGTQWNFQAPVSGGSATTTGNYSIHISGCPDGLAEYHLYSSGGFPADLGYTGISLDATNVVVLKQKYLLAVTDKQENLSYQIIDPVVNQIINLSYPNLTVGTNTRDFLFPTAFAGNFIQFAVPNGYVADRSSSLSNVGHLIRNIFLNTKKSLHASYPVEFTNHFTSLTIGANGATYTYQKFGDAPAGFTFDTSVKFTLSSNSIQDYKVTETNYNLRQSTWQSFNTQTDQAFWTIYAPPGQQKIGALPDVLVHQYPILDIHSWQHTNSQFFTLSDSYSEFVDRAKADNLNPFTAFGTEYHSVSQ